MKAIGKNVDHRYGNSGYLNKEAQLIIPHLVDVIRAKAERGINPIYLKSKWVVEDIEPSLPPELVKKGRVYEKQLVSKSLRIFGFGRKATNHKDSAFILKY
jgi:hypothetical protein